MQFAAVALYFIAALRCEACSHSHTHTHTHTHTYTRSNNIHEVFILTIFMRVYAVTIYSNIFTPVRRYDRFLLQASFNPIFLGEKKICALFWYPNVKGKTNSLFYLCNPRFPYSVFRIPYSVFRVLLTPQQMFMLSLYGLLTW